MARALAAAVLILACLASPAAGSPPESVGTPLAEDLIEASRQRITNLTNRCASEPAEADEIVVCGSRDGNSQRYRITVEPVPGARGTQSVMEERMALMNPEGGCTTVGPRGCPGSGSIPIIPIVAAVVAELLGLAEDADD